MKTSTSTSFWLSVDKRGEDECWSWLRGESDYGSLTFQGRVVRAHRLAYELSRGKIPQEQQHLIVMHSCNNRRCCNPKHLSLGTHLDNIRYRDFCGRRKAPVGEANGRAIVTEATVLKIREVYKEGNITHKRIAQQFNVKQSLINDTLSRRSWSHI